jgi:hypothetical protein
VKPKLPKRQIVFDQVGIGRRDLLSAVVEGMPIATGSLGQQRRRRGNSSEGVLRAVARETGICIMYLPMLGLVIDTVIGGNEFLTHKVRTRVIENTEQSYRYSGAKQYGGIKHKAYLRSRVLLVCSAILKILFLLTPNFAYNLVTF